MSFFFSLAPCLVGIEACATARHWAREIRRFVHDVRLLPIDSASLCKTLGAARSQARRR